MQWMMLQQDVAKDYVIATGVQYTVRSFIDKAARQLGITLEFVGEGIDEKAIVHKVTGDAAPAVKVGDVLVTIDPRYFRPAEVETLLGDASLARSDLGWIPEISLDELVRSMVAGDLASARQSALLKRHGYHIPVGKED